MYKILINCYCFYFPLCFFFNLSERECEREKETGNTVEQHINPLVSDYFQIAWVGQGSRRKTCARNTIINNKLLYINFRSCWCIKTFPRMVFSFAFISAILYFFSFFLCVIICFISSRLIPFPFLCRVLFFFSIKIIYRHLKKDKRKN